MPVTTRNGHIRNGTTPEKMKNLSDLSNGASTEAESSRQRSNSASNTLHRPSPYLLLIYPVILALGSLFAAISPIAAVRQEAFAAGITSDINNPSPTSVIPNYFAGKRNLINVLFVKRGWLWTSLAFLFLQLTTRASYASTQSNPVTTKNRMASHYLQSFLRYLLLTGIWVITTQWFFGPPLIDRSFRLTGGHCEGLPAKLEQNPALKLATLYSSSACKRSGGSWRGGHDISGHVFILVMSSASLLYELYVADRASGHPNISPKTARALAHDLSEEEKRKIGGFESEQEARLRIYARYFLWGVVGLDWLMLLTTAIWFHTWLEKVNGMLLAGLGLYLTYFLGDFVPAWRDIVGGL